MNFQITSHILFAMIFYALGCFLIFKANSKHKLYKIIGLVSIFIGVIFTILHILLIRV